MKSLAGTGIYVVIVIVVLLFVTNGCKKKDNTQPDLTDIDGNVYHAVKIGNQVWMAEDLKTTRYNDGTAITLISDSTAWSKIDITKTPGYCWYDNNAPRYRNTYGALYNWYALNTGHLAPSGWHIPSVDEWSTLITYLGGKSIAGGKLKETGTSHWISPNKGADNSSGFTALPNGLQADIGGFYFIGEWGSWWTSTEENPAWRTAYYFEIAYNETTAYKSASNKAYGTCVRCIKD
ncbi:MAG: fibrobacter succinogenes major paralogous domain-containing protein [Bacteroidota bacterium]